MKDYTDASGDNVGQVGFLIVLLRRVGATVGFLFGFGLLALVLASHASAAEVPHGDDGKPGTERSLLGSLRGNLSPVTEPVKQALRPVTPAATAVADLAKPVVGPVAEVVAPVLRPVAEVAAPVLDTVAPVVDAVAPVTEPLAGPLLRAVDPVVEPVTNAVGLRDEVGGERAEMPGSRPNGALPLPHLGTPVTVATVQQDGGVVDGAARQLADAVTNRSGQPAPSSPVGTVPGGGSVGGFGGSHGADAAVSSPGDPLADDSGSGRSPPGTIAGLPWLGYDQPNCPS